MRRPSVHSRISDPRQRYSGAPERGASIEEILADYAFLEREDILAVIVYAAHQTDHAVVHTS